MGMIIIKKKVSIFLVCGIFFMSVGILCIFIGYNFLMYVNAIILFVSSGCCFNVYMVSKNQEKKNKRKNEEMLKYSDEVKKMYDKYIL
jgi:drug/metabolite transporter (DMT)-like permease